MVLEWASANTNQTIDWDYNDNKSVAYHQFSLSQQAVFVEASDMAQWGTWFFGTGSSVGLTSQTGSSDNATRAQFIDNGRLSNTKDVNYRAIGNSRPIFAFSQDLGSLDGTEKDALFVVGIAQEQVINFRGASDSTEALAALWTTKYGSAQDAVAAFYQDWENAAEDSASLDAKIQSDSEKAGGSNYATLTTLAVRQVFGGLQVAHGSSQDYVFLKEISSDGDCSTVDVLFPAHPILLYLNSTLLKLLLDPLFEHQESGHYPNPWSIHDLGVFPNALGYAAGDDEAMPVEECGNMIIMTLAYAQRSHDHSYLAKHWPLLNQWAQFLVNDSLIPDNQLSTDDFAGTLANQTNLALKGIIGIGAMSEIANLSGVPAASSYTTTYQNTAEDYIEKWASYGIAAEANPPHTTLAYGQNDTHGLLYNLYADRLLGLNLVPQSIYDMQSDFYQTSILDFGLPLDTRHMWAKADWEVFVAAIAKADTQSLIMERLIHFVEATQSNRPLTDLYDATTGNYPVDGPSFMARPVMGGVFALLALPS
ncbi:glutaminase [Grosmannia clavigera kw1407]|uniref:Glutaminase n=1 Tax=Grosmannia clavigera (strain kw1407 / UAMH 11150) TaxID=655863 RepID=F0XCY4_GROCL|nr:glutaminase [Grosmannia clavigera kw1407]EFX04071.1 glutaminase [Grosmannia clavigera kw1407]